MGDMVSNLSGYFDEATLAAELGLTVYALRRWRQRGYGPSWAKVGRAVFYKEQDVRRFIDSQIEQREQVLAT